MSYIGYIDRVTSKTVKGWACNINALEDALSVDVFANEVLIGSVCADIFRPDLSQVGNGRHAFTFKLSKEHIGKKITALISGTDHPLIDNTELKGIDQERAIQRRDKLFAHISPGVQRGIEFGPLCTPLVRPEVGNIRYIDHASTDDLKKKYEGHTTVDIENIVDVDYVWNGQPLRELIDGYSEVDFAVASHVIEHVPNLIGWLLEIHSILKVGGILSLAIPDKRFCFDFKRQLTEPQHLVEAYLLRYTQPSPRMVFDHYSNVVQIDGDIAWNSWDLPPDPDRMRNTHKPAEALDKARRAAESGEYFDAHCWVFTPESFLDNLSVLVQLNLLPYKISTFFDTYGHEFIVSLQSTPRKETEASVSAKRSSILGAKGRIQTCPFEKKSEDTLEAGIKTGEAG